MCRSRCGAISPGKRSRAHHPVETPHWTYCSAPYASPPRLRHPTYSICRNTATPQRRTSERFAHLRTIRTIRTACQPTWPWIGRPLRRAYDGVTRDRARRGSRCFSCDRSDCSAGGSGMAGRLFEGQAVSLLSDVPILGQAQRSVPDSYGSEGWGFDSLPARLSGKRSALTARLRLVRIPGAWPRPGRRSSPVVESIRPSEYSPSAGIS